MALVSVSIAETQSLILEPYYGRIAFLDGPCSKLSQCLKKGFGETEWFISLGQLSDYETDMSESDDVGDYSLPG